tara:strand:+ start:1512 stop:3269 length:1758 start_codon:yes stop_codon:yes gene_type:complete
VDDVSSASYSALPVLVPVWEEPPSAPKDKVRILGEELLIPEPLCVLLVNRGITDPEKAKRFLRPLLSDLHPATLLSDSKKAVGRIIRAIEYEETILVHGDYDVDGLSGSALLTHWIRRLGGNVVPFVPHRVRNGYDLGPAGLEQAKISEASLIITVDSGIRAYQTVVDANSFGIDVVITDHHTPGENLPPALAVVNPNRSDCLYPNKDLCGTGVAYRICELLADEQGVDHEELHDFLDLVAIATIADVVPLNNENRTLVRYGLKALAHTKIIGLQVLMERSGLKGSLLESGQVAFKIAPLINAAGRMAEPMVALDLLMTADPVRAEEIVDDLEIYNAERRDEESSILGEALDRLAEEYQEEKDFGVVLEGEGWHPGVIGIVASRIVDRIHRPTVLVAMKDGRGRGSARSIPNFNLYDALNACREYLDSFGGHRVAAGINIASDYVDDFKYAFNTEARDRLKGQHLHPKIITDLEINLSDATEELAHFLTYFGPFGIGNPTPVFVARDVELQGTPREVGKGHLKLGLMQSGSIIEAIGFGLVKRISPESLNDGNVDLAFKLKISMFRGRRQVEAHLLDVRPHASIA